MPVGMQEQPSAGCQRLRRMAPQEGAQSSRHSLRGEGAPRRAETEVWTEVWTQGFQYNRNETGHSEEPRRGTPH